MFKCIRMEIIKFRKSSTIIINMFSMINMILTDNFSNFFDHSQWQQLTRRVIG